MPIDGKFPTSARPITQLRTPVFWRMRATPRGVTKIAAVLFVASALVATGVGCAPPPPTSASTTQESAEMKRPFMIGEAKLPSGFPPPGPVNQVIVKEYPACRAAIVQASALADGKDDTMFMSLFNHIKKHDIAMTSPVDMTYPEAGKDEGKEKPLAMAFIYGDPTIGKPGPDGVVEVTDLPSQTFVSVGIRGSYDRSHYEKGLKQLQEFLAAHAEYKLIGPPRYLGYNSPFVPWFMKFGEVQLPVTMK